MKNILDFKEFIDNNASEEFKYHIEKNLELDNSVFRIGSDAYTNLFEETKKWRDSGNIILNNKEEWMIKNLKVGQPAKFKDENQKWIDVKLDIPQRGGSKKFKVYHDSGKLDDAGNIIAMEIEQGQPGVKIKNNDPDAAASFWARQQCDLKKSMDPSTPKFWACYFASLFSKQLDLISDNPW